MTEPATPDAWYRHRWPWVLMSVPFAAVLFGGVMIGSATRYPDDVVVDTYYRDGQGINQLQDLDRAAQALGLRASLYNESAAGRAVLTLAGKDEPAVVLSLFHVTDSAQDRVIPLAREGTGRYSSTDESLQRLFSEKGVWYLELRGTDNTWRLRRRVETPLSGLEF